MTMYARLFLVLSENSFAEVKKMKKNFIVPVSFLFVGAALGFCFATVNSELPKCKKCAEAAKEEKAVKTARQRRSEGDAENRSLRRRVRELEAGKSQAAVSEEAVSEERTERPERPERPRMERGGDWFAALKTEDPERYQQITNGMARWRSDRAAQVKSRIDFLASVDTSKMSRQARETHEKLQALYAERENLQASIDEMMMGGGEVPGVFAQMRETTQAINELSIQERENLIKQTAETLGFKGEDVGEIAATIKGIIDATETGPNMQRIFPLRGGNRPGRGGTR